jgi:hypothetical protein
MTFELGKGRLQGQLDATPITYGRVPGEPSPGSVVQFKIRHGQKLYDYAAIRAGDLRWYITGGETKQGVDWHTLCEAIKPKMVGPMWVLTGRQGFTL